MANVVELNILLKVGGSVSEAIGKVLRSRSCSVI